MPKRAAATDAVSASAPRARRQATKKPNAALYIGYAEDDEDIESIMAKFAQIEKATEQKAKQQAATSSAGVTTASVDHTGEAENAHPNVTPPAEEGAAVLTEEELQRVLKVDSSKVPINVAEDHSGGGSGRSGGKGSLVENLNASKDGGYDLIAEYVPCEIDAEDAERVMAKFRYDTSTTDANADAAVTTTPAVPTPKVLDTDLFEAELYGVDAFTFLQIGKVVQKSLPEEADRVEFIERLLLPALHLRAAGVAAAARPAGTFTVPAHFKLPVARSKTGANLLELTLRGAAADVRKRMSLAEKFRTAATDLQAAIKASPADFSVHPKGVGLLCMAKNGFQAGEYLGEYLGEIFPPWRWCEREDAGHSVKKEVKAGNEIPVFYNMLMEMPSPAEYPENTKGYDVVWIDGKFRGSALTRCSHSCRPNVFTEVQPRGGRFAVSLYAKAAVACGEEVTFDYNCRTDSKREMEESICLCGTGACRGSYLSFYDDTHLHAFVEAEHTPAHATAVLLRACMHPVTDAADEAVLLRHHMPPGGSVLGDAPAWARKFAALALRFVEREKAHLAATLVGQLYVDTPEKGEGARAATAAGEGAAAGGQAATGRYTSEEAKAEAATIADARVQSLAITLDKVKYLLRQQPTATRATAPLAPLEPKDVVARVWNRDNSVVRQLLHALLGELSVDRRAEVEAAVGERFPATSAGVEAMRVALRRLSATVAGFATSPQDAHQAAADLLGMYADTRHFFAPVRFAEYTSPYVQVGHLRGGQGVLRQRKYGAHEIWAMLASWHKETCNQPEALLTASRANMELPAGAVCYTSMQPYQRQAVMDKLAAQPFEKYAAGAKNKLLPFGGVCKVPLGEALCGCPAMDRLLDSEL